MQKFEIILKNDRIKFYDQFAVFIFLLNGSGIIWALIYSDLTFLQQSSGGISLLLLITAILIHLTSSIRLKKEYFFLLAAIVVVLYWILSGYWWIGVAVFFLSLLYLMSKKDLVVRTSVEDITYPSFPKRQITWEELNNVILKDGLLTIDFKNNKLIQQSIHESKTSVNEKEFNDFCRQQLKTASSTI